MDLMKQPPTSKGLRITCGIILLGALLVRLWGLKTDGYWLDEVMQIRAAALPETVGAVWRAVPYDKPPLVYLQLHALTRWGLDEAWLRWPSLLAGVLTVVLGLLLARSVYPGQSVPTIAAGLLLAISPLSVQLSREVLPYAQSAACVAAAFYLAMRWLDTGQARNLWATFMAATLALWLTYQSLASLAMLGLAAMAGWLMFLISHGWPNTRNHPKAHIPTPRLLLLAGAVALAVLTTVPLWPRMASIMDRQVPWQAPPLDGATLRFLGQALVAGFDGSTPNPIWILAAIPVLVECAGLACDRWRARSETDGDLWLAPRGVLMLWLFGGMILLYLLAILQRHWIASRYLVYFIPPLAILAAGGIGRLAGWYNHLGWKWLVPMLLIAALTLGTLPTLRQAMHSRPDLRGLARKLAAKARPGDLVLFQHSYDEFSYTFYQQFIIKGAPVAVSYQYSTPEDIDLTVADRIRSANRLWIPELTYGAYPIRPEVQVFFTNGRSHANPQRSIHVRKERRSRALQALFTQPEPAP